MTQPPADLPAAPRHANRLAAETSPYLLQHAHQPRCGRVVENHAAAVAIHFMYRNFAAPMKVLADPYPRTPAMAAGIADHIWTCEEIAALLD
jgi:hypothetical protein